jgi:hypothetical protein
MKVVRQAVIVPSRFTISAKAGGVEVVSRGPRKMGVLAIYCCKASVVAVTFGPVPQRRKKFIYRYMAICAE